MNENRLLLDNQIPVTIQEMISKGCGMHNETTQKHLVFFFFIRMPIITSIPN